MNDFITAIQKLPEFKALSEKEQEKVLKLSLKHRKTECHISVKNKLEAHGIDPKSVPQELRSGKPMPTYGNYKKIVMKDVDEIIKIMGKSEEPKIEETKEEPEETVETESDEPNTDEDDEDV